MTNMFISLPQAPGEKNKFLHATNLQIDWRELHLKWSIENHWEESEIGILTLWLPLSGKWSWWQHKDLAPAEGGDSFQL